MNYNLLSDCLKLTLSAEQTITLLEEYRLAGINPPLPYAIDKALKQTFTDYRTFTDKHGKQNFKLHRFLIATQHLEYMATLKRT